MSAVRDPSDTLNTDRIEAGFALGARVAAPGPNEGRGRFGFPSRDGLAATPAARLRSHAPTRRHPEARATPDAPRAPASPDRGLRGRARTQRGAGPAGPPRGS